MPSLVSNVSLCLAYINNYGTWINTETKNNKKENIGKRGDHWSLIQLSKLKLENDLGVEMFSECHVKKCGAYLNLV